MQLDLLGERCRTHMCGELRKAHVGQKVFLAGWVDRRRDLGNLIFIDLRDHTGMTQVVVSREKDPEAHEKGEQVRSEFVVGVEGEVLERSAETVNAQVATGEVEVRARRLLILNEAKTPPFAIEDETKTAEETRLRYRYLDLRRPRMQERLRLRHRAALAVREHLSEHKFVEVETPFMTRSTPEGARDFLVPSRIQHGKFYALPQSPQLFKQLLMIGGTDRYFQIVRCFRDEDFRADRQAEFTQVDIEMAFPEREALFEIIEGLMEKLWALAGVQIERPFPHLTYDEAMERFGSDKPDLRFGLEWRQIAVPAAAREKLRLFESLKAMRLPKLAEISRSQLDRLQDFARTTSADWFSYFKVSGRGIQSPLGKVIGDEAVKALAEGIGAEPGDLVLLLGIKKSGTTSPRTTRSSADRRLDEASGVLRLEAARRFELIPKGGWHFAWIVDFPMFEFDEKEKRFNAMHHPFTSPQEEDLEKLESDPGDVKALAYDLVLNGSEIGGGSIRIHRQDIQRRVFKALGMTEEQARARFGFFLDALEYGTPPHGGIALGFDRIVALLSGESNIREVIAFPKTASAVDLMCEAPAEVDSRQLDELGIRIK
ncbi:MAG: aspartate--tRNA ligase [Acidobacteria bacterium]|nr:MAG: aspartate--tRNA ligase [Acidobacteriota bacterium]